MSNPNQLFLLADHIKLSLLERQRAQTLNLDATDSKDGHIARSLEQFRDGLEALRGEQARLEEAGDEDGALTVSDTLPGLQKQYDDLISQFHGFSSPSAASTLTHPNDPVLAGDFEHAASTTTATTGPASSLRPKGQRSVSSKTVRFTDNPSPPAGSANRTAVEEDEEAADLEAQRLFGRPRYRDDPEGGPDPTEEMTNRQIHAYHEDVLRDQDEHLDRLGASISRQRELSLRIGDELDGQVALLDEVDEHVDRHQGRLDRARRQVGRISRAAAGDARQMAAIIALIIILILLIALLK
ncbi:hypothetical protein DL764_010946 [Monosporascus ibericus]|uniref:t-SNARE coiled-coil homology domain-containing protein n=1 Tax=Monosporascus ibericus TaxID=155417 RepID=A0A4Q4SRW1_9PEZI|nr:hypothetical protein DL764_010946 [Monosporascus ibericus]